MNNQTTSLLGLCIETRCGSSYSSQLTPPVFPAGYYAYVDPTDDVCSELTHEGWDSSFLSFHKKLLNFTIPTTYVNTCIHVLWKFSNFRNPYLCNPFSFLLTVLNSQPVSGPVRTCFVTLNILSIKCYRYS